MALFCSSERTCSCLRISDEYKRFFRADGQIRALLGFFILHQGVTVKGKTCAGNLQQAFMPPVRTSFALMCLQFDSIRFLPLLSNCVQSGFQSHVNNGFLLGSTISFVVF